MNQYEGKMENQPIPINPQNPVSGNLAGTFTGFIAIMVAGYIANAGWFVALSHYISQDPNICAQLENGLFVFVIALIGSVVNYAVTHFAQVKKLKELYDAIPATYREFPHGKNAENQTGKN